MDNTRPNETREVMLIKHYVCGKCCRTFEGKAFTNLSKFYTEHYHNCSEEEYIMAYE